MVCLLHTVLRSRLGLPDMLLYICSRLKNCVPFDPGSFAGYAHQRTAVRCLVASIRSRLMTVILTRCARLYVAMPSRTNICPILQNSFWLLRRLHVVFVLALLNISDRRDEAWHHGVHVPRMQSQPVPGVSVSCRAVIAGCADASASKRADCAKVKSC
jgi:hypothetical protein